MRGRRPFKRQMAVWLRAKVCDSGLGMQPRLYAGYLCNDGAVKMVFATIEPYLYVLYYCATIRYVNWRRHWYNSTLSSSRNQPCHLKQRFSTVFDLLPKTAPRHGSLLPSARPNYARTTIFIREMPTYFGYTTIKREIMTSYNHQL